MLKKTKIGMTQLARVIFKFVWNRRFIQVICWLMASIWYEGVCIEQHTNISEAFLAQFEGNSTVPTLSYKYNFSNNQQIHVQKKLVRSWLNMKKVSSTDLRKSILDTWLFIRLDFFFFLSLPSQRTLSSSVKLLIIFVVYTDHLSYS